MNTIIYIKCNYVLNNVGYLKNCFLLLIEELYQAVFIESFEHEHQNPNWYLVGCKNKIVYGIYKLIQV